MRQTIKLAVAISGAVILGWITPSCAAPVSSSVTALKQAATSDVVDVYYRRRYVRRYYNPGVAVGLGILGAAAGAAIIGSGGYYGPGYGYYGPGYGYYEPDYYAPRYYGHPYRRGYYYAPY